MSVTKQDLEAERMRRVSAEAKVVAAQVAMREWQARAMAAEAGVDNERASLEKRLAAAEAELAKSDAERAKADAKRDGLEKRLAAAEAALTEANAGAEAERAKLEKRLSKTEADHAEALKAAEAVTQKAEAQNREIATLKDALADIEAQRDGWQREQKGLAKVVSGLPTSADVQERDAKIEDLNAALSAALVKAQSLEKAADKERQDMAKRLAKVEAALAKAEAMAEKAQETAKRAREALAVRPDVVELGRLRAELDKMQREASVG